MTTTNKQHSSKRKYSASNKPLFIWSNHNSNSILEYCKLFTVFALGYGILHILYLNILLAESYLFAIFWAVVTYIPLYVVKKSVIHFLTKIMPYDDSNQQIFNKVLQLRHNSLITKENDLSDLFVEEVDSVKKFKHSFVPLYEIPNKSIIEIINIWMVRIMKILKFIFIPNLRINTSDFYFGLMIRYLIYVVLSDSFEDYYYIYYTIIQVLIISLFLCILLHYLVLFIFNSRFNFFREYQIHLIQQISHVFMMNIHWLLSICILIVFFLSVILILFFLSLKLGEEFVYIWSVLGGYKESIAHFFNMDDILSKYHRINHFELNDYIIDYIPTHYSNKTVEVVKFVIERFNSPMSIDYSTSNDVFHKESLQCVATRLPQFGLLLDQVMTMSLAIPTFQTIKDFLFLIGSAYEELLNFFSLENLASSSSSHIKNAFLFLISIFSSLFYHGTNISVNGIEYAISLLSGISFMCFDSVIQFLIYLTVLYYLLASHTSLYSMISGPLNTFVDTNGQVTNAVFCALNAILFSSLKMALFHSIFTWLFFNYYDFALVYIPTIIAFLMGAVPIFSPILICAFGCFLIPFSYITICIIFIVYWFVGPIIYAEIPQANTWITSASVGLGVGWFGIRGVIIGPLLATIPFVLYNICLKHNV